MSEYTTSNYIDHLAFDYFETYSFQRGSDYAILDELVTKRANERLNAEDRMLFDKLTAATQKIPNGVFDDTGAFNETSVLVATVSKVSAEASKLIEILHTPIVEEMHFMCYPVYRDAILFYDAEKNLVDGINICFQCSVIESIRKKRIATDYKTFKYLKQFLLSLGHYIEDPDYFMADDIDQLAKKHKQQQQAREDWLKRRKQS